MRVHRGFLVWRSFQTGRARPRKIPDDRVRDFEPVNVSRARSPRRSGERAHENRHDIVEDPSCERPREIRMPDEPIQENTPMSGFLKISDRKSTRLNSSHANISYAVFCLKKKKKK